MGPGALPDLEPFPGPPGPFHKGIKGRAGWGPGAPGNPKGPGDGIGEATQRNFFPNFKGPPFGFRAKGPGPGKRFPSPGARGGKARGLTFSFGENFPGFPPQIFGGPGSGKGKGEPGNGLGFPGKPNRGGFPEGG